MQPIDAGSQEQAMPEVIIGQEQQARAQARGLLQTFRALRHRNYRLFFFGQMISQVGTWMQTTAQAWLVLELTHSALLLGLLGVLQYLPVMVFSLAGGVLADRVPKRTLLLVTQSVALVQAINMWLLVVTGTVQIWHIMLLCIPCRAGGFRLHLSSLWAWCSVLSAVGRLGESQTKHSHSSDRGVRVQLA